MGSSSNPKKKHKKHKSKDRDHKRRDSLEHGVNDGDHHHHHHSTSIHMDHSMVDPNSATGMSLESSPVPNKPLRIVLKVNPSPAAQSSIPSPAEMIPESNPFESTTTIIDDTIPTLHTATGMVPNLDITQVPPITTVPGSSDLSPSTSKKPKKSKKSKKSKHKKHSHSHGHHHHHHHHHHHSHHHRHCSKKHQQHGTESGDTNQTGIIEPPPPPPPPVPDIEMANVSMSGGIYPPPPPFVDHHQDKMMEDSNLAINAASVTADESPFGRSAIKLKLSTRSPKRRTSPPPPPTIPIQIQSPVPAAAVPVTPKLASPAVVTPSVPTIPVAAVKEKPSPLKQLLLHLLKLLQRKDQQNFFAQPVSDTIAPGYSSIIAHPMDLSTIKAKINDGSYRTLGDFNSDVKLMCDNAMKYNRPETIYYKAANKLWHYTKSKLFKKDSLLDYSKKYPKLTPLQLSLMSSNQVMGPAINTAMPTTMAAQLSDPLPVPVVDDTHTFGGSIMPTVSIHQSPPIRVSTNGFSDSATTGFHQQYSPGHQQPFGTSDWTNTPGSSSGGGGGLLLTTPTIQNIPLRSPSPGVPSIQTATPAAAAAAMVAFPSPTKSAKLGRPPKNARRQTSTAPSSVSSAAASATPDPKEEEEELFDGLTAAQLLQQVQEAARKAQQRLWQSRRGRGPTHLSYLHQSSDGQLYLRSVDCQPPDPTNRPMVKPVSLDLIYRPTETGRMDMNVLSKPETVTKTNTNSTVSFPASWKMISTSATTINKMEQDSDSNIDNSNSNKSSTMETNDQEDHDHGTNDKSSERILLKEENNDSEQIINTDENAKEKLIRELIDELSPHYGNSELGLNYALSIARFARNSEYTYSLVTSLLSVLTDGEHRQVLTKFHRLMQESLAD